MSWKKLESEEIFRAGFFRLRQDKCELPDGRVMPRYFVVEFTDWVHVLPITKQGQVVAVDQYRYPIDKKFVEAPGGAVDEGEEPRIAASRELQEETGYSPGELIHLGTHYPNPAIQENRLHSYLALDCELESSQKLDPYEDLEVKLIDLQSFIDMVFTQQGNHSLMIASVALALPEFKKRGIL